MSKRNRRRNRHRRNKAKNLPDWYHKYLDYINSDPNWKKFRESILTLRGHKCERCGSSKQLQVHHKNYKNLYKETAQDVELLCKVCHKAEHREAGTGNFIKRHREKQKFTDRKPVNTFDHSLPTPSISAITFYPNRKKTPLERPLD